VARQSIDDGRDTSPGTAGIPAGLTNSVFDEKAGKDAGAPGEALLDPVFSTLTPY